MLSGAGPSLGQTQDNALDRSVELVGGAVSSLADRLDSFLGNERTEAEANRTRLRVGGGVGWLRKDGTKLEGTLDLRLSLPRTGHRLSVFVNSADNQQPDTTVRQGLPVATLTDQRRFETAGIGARYFFIRNPGESLRLDAGGQKGINLDPFVRPRHRLTFQAGSWTLTPIQEASWSLADGFGALGLIDADWQIDDRSIFRLSPAIRWDEKHPGFGYGLAARDLRVLAPTRVLESVVAVGFRSEKTDWLDTAVLRLRYRQTVWRDWLELEVAPELGFQRVHDYAVNPGIFVRLQVTFGPTDIRGGKDAPARPARFGY